jgi:hypothetical protein
LEEEHGLGRHAMAVYDRAIEAVDAIERFGLFNIYLKKASEIYGVTRDQFYKTFYSCNLQLFVPGKPFQPSLMFVVSAGTPEWCFTRVGSCLTRKCKTKPERLVRDKH